MSLYNRHESSAATNKHEGLFYKNASNFNSSSNYRLKELISKFQNMMGEQVIWVAIAAIGGSLVAIWNILKYLFTFLSSFFKHIQTNVPVYIFMESRDHGISDARLFFIASMVVIMILSFTYVIPIPKILNDFFIIVLFIALVFISNVLLMMLLDNYELVNPSILDDPLIISFLKMDIGTIFFIQSTIFMLISICVGKDYTDCKTEYRITKNLYTSLQKKSCDLSKQFQTIKKQHYENSKFEISTEVIEKKIEIFTHSSLQKETAKKLYKLDKDLRRKRHGVLTIYFAVVIFLIVETYSSPYYLIDQYNRIVIADLGEQFVVQEAVIDDARGIILIDTSSYSFVNSLDENVKVRKYKLNQLDTLNTKEKSENEITIANLMALIGKEKKDIPYDIGKCLWKDKIYFETTDTINLYGYEGNVIFEINGGVLVNAFWVNYTLQEIEAPYEEIHRLINLISESTKLEKQELSPDELVWESIPDGVRYYMEYHEVPLVIGVERM